MSMWSDGITSRGSSCARLSKLADTLLDYSRHGMIDGCQFEVTSPKRYIRNIKTSAMPV